MKAGEVLRLLQISRPTLTKYVKNGLIKVKRKENGQYEYDDSSVYEFIYKGVKRQTILYCRVARNTQKEELKKQEVLLKQFCLENGYDISSIYSEVACSLDFNNRSRFIEMLDIVLDGKVERVIILNRDIISKVGFNLFQHIFKKFGCEIITLNEPENYDFTQEETLEESTDLLECNF